MIMKFCTEKPSALKFLWESFRHGPYRLAVCFTAVLKIITFLKTVPGMAACCGATYCLLCPACRPLELRNISRGSVLRAATCDLAMGCCHAVELTSHPAYY